jgi:hypothetical protein
MIIFNLFFIDRGVQKHGYIDPKTNKFVFVEEMVPELIVPDLKDFKVLDTFILL